MEEHVDKFEKIERMDPDEFIARLYEIYREIPDFHGNIRRIKKAGQLRSLPDGGRNHLSGDCDPASLPIPDPH